MGYSREEVELANRYMRKIYDFSEGALSMLNDDDYRVILNSNSFLFWNEIETFKRAWIEFLKVYLKELIRFRHWLLILELVIIWIMCPMPSVELIVSQVLAFGTYFLLAFCNKVFA